MQKDDLTRTQKILSDVKIIAIEGVDGSGKGTQAKLLAEYIENLTEVYMHSFPSYTQTFFGEQAGKFLNGQLGDPKVIPAKFASLLYALDRFEVKDEIDKQLKSNNLVIFDRYVGSNIAYQSTRYEGDLEEFIEWLSYIEYIILGCNKPTITFFLDVPVEFSKQLVRQKKARDYIDQSEDAFESDYAFIERVYKTYQVLAKKWDWKVIQCVEEGKLLSIEAIHQKIIEALLES